MGCAGLCCLCLDLTSLPVPGLRGSFSLELPVGPELAPTATVLCYTVLPSGEMVADSIKISLAKCLPNKVSGGCWRPENLPLACHGALSCSRHLAASQPL